MARMSIEELREQVPVTKEVGYFQTGTYGPAMASVVKAVQESMEYEAIHGPARPATRQFIMEKEEAARANLAELLNVKPDELGLGSNTTRSMQRVLRNIDWQEGDEFVTTSVEHVSTADASRGLEQERGVVAKVVDADESDAAFLESLDGAVTERAKLMRGQRQHRPVQRLRHPDTLRWLQGQLRSRHSGSPRTTRRQHRCRIPGQHPGSRASHRRDRRAQSSQRQTLQRPSPCRDASAHLK